LRFLAKGLDFLDQKQNFLGSNLFKIFELNEKFNHDIKALEKIEEKDLGKLKILLLSK
jgi:hypothetical protein